MALVTISREYGSAGSATARKVAELLDYHFVDKAVIGKILAGYGLIDFESEYDARSGIWSTIDARQRVIVSMLERVTRAIARHGDTVILGRGSYVILAHEPGVLNVRLHAPFAWRVTRVMQEEGITDQARAEAIVREGDKVRASFISAFYGLRWDSFERFDIALDTSKIGSDRAAAWIAEAAKALPGAAPPKGSPGESSNPNVDSILDEAVSAELGREEKSRGSHAEESASSTN
ncbi:MAG TPA: cytidylate kinase-like family protein [Rectinemataceae bacterium]|nr:cytidylate kinase-like family protein [Rectinemataceae bacterium]